MILTHKHSIKLIKKMEIDDLLPEKPLSTLFFHGIFWKSKTSNTVDFPKAFPENLAWGNSRITETRSDRRSRGQSDFGAVKVTSKKRGVFGHLLRLPRTLLEVMGCDPDDPAT